jgi:hypothetical protein
MKRRKKDNEINDLGMRDFPYIRKGHPSVALYHVCRSY